MEISVGLSVFGKRTLRKLPGSKGDKVMGEWRTIHKDKFSDFVSHQMLRRLQKSRMTR